MATRALDGAVIDSFRDSSKIIDCGKYCTIYLSTRYENHFGTILKGRYAEIKSDTFRGECLTAVGSRAIGFTVDETPCHGHASQLWNFVREKTIPGIWYQFRSKYATSAYKHAACMWNPRPGSVVITVRKCVAKPRVHQQVWAFMDY